MERSEIQGVAETKEGLYLLMIFSDTDEDDGGNAIGHVYRTSSRPEGEPQQVLATNDTLRAMWASPGGKLWVASADGNVGTTAKVKWPPPTDGADYQAQGGSPAWSVTGLPRLPNGLPPNIDLIWGTADDDVYAGAYGGHILHWDGRAWTIAFPGPGGGKAGIRAFGGTSPADVYAVGAERTLLHHDGRAWKAIAPPPPKTGRENFTGVQTAPDGQVLICSSLGSESGRVLHGDASGLVERARCKFPLIGSATVENRTLFATPKGVAELIDDRIELIKTSFEPVAIFPGRARVFFTEPAPEDPTFRVYEPGRTEKPWSGYVY